ncbi:MAG TPA: hypothetical protein DIT25_04205 [Candidatus Moranbacteria bacterium]|nr:hypothetical protein [Candidatus Moranbacteria bacterium]
MKKKLDYFHNLGKSVLKSLEVPDGILASGEHIYSCIFGRDSLITALKLLRAYRSDPDLYYLELTKKILNGLAKLQGSEVNIESGEEPGKMIHEFRITGHERLTQSIPPWYQYPDGTMRNFDTVDATPLFLITTYRFYQRSGDHAFIAQIEENIKMALVWILEYGDKNGDGFINYQTPPERKSGGLLVHNWMDSSEAVFHEDEKLEIIFPIAPAEAQAYSYLALKLWAPYFSERDKKFSQKLIARADDLKKNFNKEFVLANRPEQFALAHSLDGKGNPLASMRSTAGHILWACLNPIDDGKTDCILEEKYVPALVRSLFDPDLFEENAGIRTLSKKSRSFDPLSYHNGSIWPHDNSIIAEGLENLGYVGGARNIRKAIFKAFDHFKTPIELFVYWNGEYREYKSPGGQIGCRNQAWSAAAMIADSLALKKPAK